MYKNVVYIAGLFLMTLIIVTGCSKGHLTVDEAYNELRPVKQLELPEQISENLVVIIDNVADEGTSYKNRVELFINNKKIDPDWLVSNVQDKYIYKLRVRPGYYKVKAYYYAYVGWGEDRYEIESNELVRVQHDKQTTVSCTIVKKPNGEPINKTMYFDVTQDDFEAPQKQSATLKMDKTVVKSSLQNKPRPLDMVTLQINTVPEHAQIIIDDQVVGQSPLRFNVDRRTDHIVQISAPGYQTKTKFIDRSKFGHTKSFYLIQKLEKE